MPGLKIGDAFLSIERTGVAENNKDKFRCYLDFGSWGIVDDGLRSGYGGCGLQEGLESLLSFLEAAAEAYEYKERTGSCSENIDLFEPNVVEWAYEHSDEIGMLRLELEENEGLIVEMPNGAKE
jgi:hypothetical protein